MFIVLPSRSVIISAARVRPGPHQHTHSDTLHSKTPVSWY